MDKLMDADLSIALGQQIRSKSRQPFDNAYRAALVTPEARYIQGFLVIARHPFHPIEHAWLELPDYLLDPSFSLLSCQAQQLTYFPAHSLTLKQIKAAIEEAKEDYPEDDPLPIYGAMPYEYYGDVMLGGKPYAEAFAKAEAFGLDLQKTLSDHRDRN
jgi:hypothetical protein